MQPGCFWALAAGWAAFTWLIPDTGVLAREKFWLNEVRTLSTWEATRDTLTEDGVLGEGDHFELFLNPYPDDGGQHSVLVTRRRDCPDPGEPYGAKYASRVAYAPRECVAPLAASHAGISVAALLP